MSDLNSCRTGSSWFASRSPTSNAARAALRDAGEKLEAAGFTDLSFERIDGPVMIGRDVDQAVDFQDE
jgi:hypothetical protein